MSIHTFFVLLSLLNWNCSAEVDLKNGNFFYSWVDAQLSSKNFFWELQRSYNSRVDRVGYFGQGWCSPLETKLTKFTKTIEIQNCGSGETVVYQDDKGQWIHGDQVISLVDAMYVLKVKGVTQLQFNQNGDLDAFWLRDEKAKLKYLDGHLSRIETTAGTFSFTFDESSKIIELNLGSGKTVKYTYQGNNLVSVHNAWGNKFFYQYDQFGNMTLAQWPDKTVLKLHYDTRRDWITRLIDRDGCSEHYSYASKKISDTLKVTSTAQRSCKNKHFDKKIIEIVFDKQNKLKNIKQMIAGTWKQIEYTDLGKPKKITDNSGLKQQFDYDKNGSLILKTDGTEKSQYALNKKKQVIQINTSQTILKLEYDDRGRVVKVVANQHHVSKELLISYIDLSERLKTLEIKGSGRITYSYDNNGNLENTTLKAAHANQTDFEIDINRIYGLYSLLTDEAAIYGGLN